MTLTDKEIQAKLDEFVLAKRRQEAIRHELLLAGVEIEELPEGIKWRKIETHEILP